MECWNPCDPAVLRYQTHWLIFWTLVIVKRKMKRRRTIRTSLTLMISVKVMVNDDLTIITLTPMRG